MRFLASCFAILLSGCVHESAATGFATATLSSVDDGQVKTVETICRGSVVDGITDKNEIAIQSALTPRGGCWRSTCRGEGCAEAGNPALVAESRLADKQVAETRSQEKVELAKKYGADCADGRGDFDACFELAARLDNGEIDRIKKNLCARKDEIRCVKKQRELKNGSFTVSRLVTDLNCLAADGATTCTYTDVEVVRSPTKSHGSEGSR